MKLLEGIYNQIKGHKIKQEAETALHSMIMKKFIKL